MRSKRLADAAVVGLSDGGGEVGEVAAGVFDRGSLPLLSASAEDFIADMQRDGSWQQVEADLIAVVDQRDRALIPQHDHVAGANATLFDRLGDFSATLEADRRATGGGLRPLVLMRVAVTINAADRSSERRQAIEDTGGPKLPPVAPGEGHLPQKGRSRFHGKINERLNCLYKCSP